MGRSNVGYLDAKAAAEKDATVLVNTVKDKKTMYTNAEVSKAVLVNIVKDNAEVSKAVLVNTVKDNAEVSKAVLVNTVKDKKTMYTNTEISKAEFARALQRKLGHVSKA